MQLTGGPPGLHSDGETRRIARILETFGFEKRLRFFRQQLQEERARIGHQLRVVDVGCGTGETLTLPLDHECHQIVRIGLHLPSLQAGRRTTNGPFVCAETSAFRSGAFDVAICSEVLEHVRNPAELLTDARRLLHPGGSAL